MLKDKKIKIVGVVVILFLMTSVYFIGEGLSKKRNLGRFHLSSIERLGIERPDRQAEVMGRIKSIIGNEIIIEKLNRSENPTSKMSIEERQKYMSALTKEERIELMEATFNSTSGEDFKITIPPGTPIVERERLMDEENADKERNIKLTDLKVGQRASVWLNNSIADKSIAELILITIKL